MYELTSLLKSHFSSVENLQIHRLAEITYFNSMNYLYTFSRGLRFFLILFSLSFIFACSSDDPAPKPEPEPEIRQDAAFIDASQTHQTIRGFGAATVFRLDTPLNESDMDLLFGTGEGELGLSILRIRVISDQSPSGRAIELKHAQGAKSRGAIVIASPWSPPARMKTNNSLIGGRLAPEYYEEYAVYLNDFAEYMAENNAALYAISVQNEPDIEVDYESADWTPGEILEFVAEHGDKITSTRLMSAESFNFNHAVTDPLLKDPEALENLDIIGGHIYGGGLTDYPLAREKGIEVWMTEHLDTEITWEAVFATAKEIHHSMATANFNAYLWWYAKRFYGPINEEGEVTKRGYVMSHFSKFVRPGYQRIEATETPQPDVLISAYTGNGKTVIVAINSGNTPVRQQFVLESGMHSSFLPYRTTESASMQQQPSIALEEEIGAFTATLPPESITTFVSE